MGKGDGREAVEVLAKMLQDFWDGYNFETLISVMTAADFTSSLLHLPHRCHSTLLPPPPPQTPRG